MKDALAQFSEGRTTMSEMRKKLHQGERPYKSSPSLAHLVGKNKFLHTLRPRGTCRFGTRTLQIHGFDMGPKFFQIHDIPNVGHSFTSQLHGY